MLECRVLGAVRVVEDGRDVHIGGARLRRLLAMLLVHRNEVVSADRLAEAVFAGAPTPGAETTLRSYVARLRRSLGDGLATGPDRPVVTTRSPGYVLSVPDDQLDAARFEALVARGRDLMVRGDPWGASAVLRRGLDLWEGEAYAEFADEDWVRPEAQRLRELRLLAEEQLIDAQLACGNAPELIARLEVLVDRDPLRESFRARLMSALYDSGRQVEALEVMRDYRALLDRELGLDPSPELVALEHRILAHEQEDGPVEHGAGSLRGYRLGDRLGSGRDGTVRAARLPGVDRDLAIRIVPASIADRPDVVRRFDATMHQVASLHHAAVVPVHDHWREAGAAYVVMRRLHGGTLRDRMDGGPLPAPEVVDLARRVGGALAAAAELGIVHGRVVPESVLFDTSGRPFLGDFPLGEADAGPDDDVRAFVALVAEAATGTRDPDLAAPALPTTVARLLRASAQGRPVPPIGSVVSDVVAALGGPHGLAGDGTGAPINPYKGLRAFEESDAADFFGRDELVDRLLQRLAGDDLASRFVLLVGASGSGKSSVVRAGLLPRIRTGDVPGTSTWLVTVMVPGPAPFSNLAEGLRAVATTPRGDEPGPLPDGDDLVACLRRDERGVDTVVRQVVPVDGGLLLVLDQFEELFTLAAEDDQRAFLAGLLRAVSAPDSRLRVVATLRADCYDQPLRFPGFGEALRDMTLTMPPMGAAQLEEAITGPAGRVGIAVEPGLVAELVAAVVDEPTALPSLQFTLYELVERADGPCVGLDGYRDLGGVGGAIAARAEDLYRSRDDDRATVRRLFEELVVIGADGIPARRRTPRNELAAVVTGRLDEVVAAWVRARLLAHDRDPVTRAPTVEIAHEALLHAWPRLRTWVDDHRDAIATAGRLREAAARWEALDRDPDVLLRGKRLRLVLDRLDGRTEDLPPLARDYLEASRAARVARRRQEQERARRQAAANRRLRLQLVALAGALLVALVGGAIALDQGRRAEAERHVAVARELAADAVAAIDEDPELAVLLALAAVDETRTADGEVVPEALAALHRTVAEARIVLTVPELGGAVDWSPDGTAFVTEGPDGSGMVDLRDAADGDSLWVVHGHDVDVNDVVFSGGGTMIATTGDDGFARVWDRATGDPVVAVAGRGAVWGPSFSRDGRALAAAWSDEGVVRVVGVPDGSSVREFRVVAGRTAFSPVDDRLAMAARDVAIVVDTTTGERLLTLEPPGGPATPLGASRWAVSDVSWSPDGTHLATVGTDGAARVWDATTGDLRAVLWGHAAGTVRVDWSPDSTRLATSSDDGTARVWAVEEGGGRELVRLPSGATRAGVVGVSFSPDGQRLLTGEAGSVAARVFDIGPSGGAEVANLPTSPDVPGAVGFTAAGSGVVASADGAAAVEWDLATGEPRTTLGQRRPDALASDVDGTLVVPSPDGRLVATSTLRGPVRVWDLVNGSERFTVGPTPATPDAAWSPDGAHLAVIGRDDGAGWVRVLDRDGNVVAEIVEDDVVWLSVAFGPDGDRIVTTRRATGGGDEARGGVHVWDWASGEALTHLVVPAWEAVLDPTGTRIATNDLSTGAAIHDAATGTMQVALSGHGGPVLDLEFAPDGASLATASVDGTVRLWDAETGREDLVLAGHVGPVAGVAFSPDGSRLASVGRDQVRVWSLDVDEVVDIAGTRLTRSLTDAECQQYLHLARCP